jgi:hypothetical protein
MKLQITNYEDLLNALRNLSPDQIKQKPKTIYCGAAIESPQITEVEITEEPFYEGPDSAGYRNELLNEGFTDQQIEADFKITEPVGTVILYTA